MKNAGIIEGDLVVVRSQEEAANGEIVVALVGEDEATVKRYFRESDHIRLQPENDELEPIRSREVRVLGRVVGVMRQIA
jgi:repressor LexA